MGESIFDLLGPLDRIIRMADEPPGPAAPAAAGGGPEDGPSTRDPSPFALPALGGAEGSGGWTGSGRSSARWSAFSEISHLLTSSRIDFDEVLRAILDLVIRYTGAERGLLILCGEKGALDIEIARSSREAALDPQDVAYSRSIVRWTLAEKRPWTGAGEGLRSISDSVASLGLRAAMCVPLLVTPVETPGGPPLPVAVRNGSPADRRRFGPEEPEVLGVIYVDSAADDEGVRPQDLDFFVALANQATSTILNARLYQQATTDPLSRLFTRWHMARVLADAARRAAQRALPYSIVLLDLDDFKAVNDAHGHPVGDQVIRDLGETLRGATRGQDACFRYGGEEFAVVLGDTDEAGALVAAEKVRAAIARRRFGDPGLAVTASIGIAAAPPAAHDPDEIVKRADQALYHAKSGGKNRVVRWTAAIGAAAKRSDRLAGIVTGDFAADYKNVAALLDAVAAVSRAGDVGEVITVAVDKVIEATGAERGALMLGDEEKLTTVVARDRRGKNLELKERFSRTIPERVLAGGASVCVGDATDGAGGPAPRSVSELSLRTVLCVPLATRDRTLGVLYVDSRARGALGEASLPFLEGLARHVAVVVENARLRARLLYEEGSGS